MGDSDKNKYSSRLLELASLTTRMGLCLADWHSIGINPSGLPKYERYDMSRHWAVTVTPLINSLAFVSCKRRRGLVGTIHAGTVTDFDWD